MKIWYRYLLRTTPSMEGWRSKLRTALKMTLGQGVQKNLTTVEQVDTIHSMVLEGRCLIVQQIAKFICISSGSVQF